MSECIAGSTYTFPINVIDATNPLMAKANPTIDASDFLVSLNGGSWDALDNEPTVSPAGSEVILITFSADETTAASGGFVVVRVADASNDGGWIGGEFAIRVYADSRASATVAAAIQERTDNLPDDPADDSVVAAAITAAQAAITDAIATVATPAQVAAALATYDAPTFAEMVEAFTEIKGATWATTDTLEAIRDRGDEAWATATGFATPTNVSDAQAAIIADTGATEAAALAAIAALNNLSAAQVNAEIVDVLTVDTYAEPTSAPAATSSLKDKIGWVFKILRNKMTQTATTQTLFADDGTTADNTSSTSTNSTTVTRGEWQ